MLNTGDGRMAAAADTPNVHYTHLNVAFRRRQEQTQANHEAGYDAWHANRKKRPYVDQPHSSSWLSGWRAAKDEGARSLVMEVHDLCPGAVEPPKAVGADPGHAHGHFCWACAECGVRIGGTHGEPTYVPIHPLMPDAEGGMPIVGAGPETLRADPSGNRNFTR